MRAVVLCLAATLAACGSDPVVPPGTGALAIGTSSGDGTPGYTPMTDGAELVLEPGAQGGFHVFIGIRIDDDGMGHFNDQPLISREARRESTGQLVSRSKHRTDMAPSESAPGFFDSENSIPLFLCPTPIGIPVADEVLILKVWAADDYDVEPALEGEIRFVPRCPEGDQKQFCENICFG